jgi:hypothetical protein
MRRRGRALPSPAAAAAVDMAAAAPPAGTTQWWRLLMRSDAGGVRVTGAATCSHIALRGMMHPAFSSLIAHGTAAACTLRVSRHARCQPHTATTTWPRTCAAAERPAAHASLPPMDAARVPDAVCSCNEPPCGLAELLLQCRPKSVAGRCGGFRFSARTLAMWVGCGCQKLDCHFQATLGTASLLCGHVLRQPYHPF